MLFWFLQDMKLLWIHHLAISVGYVLRSDDYIDANIKLALSAATEVITLFDLAISEAAGP